MSDFYSATIFLSVFIMIIMDMLVSGNDLMEHDKKQTVCRRFTRSPYW